VSGHHTAQRGRHHGRAPSYEITTGMVPNPHDAGVKTGWERAERLRRQPDRADMVKKSRPHHDSKYRWGEPAMVASRSVPLSGAACPDGAEGV